MYIYAYICTHIYVKPSKHEVHKFKLVSRDTFPKHSQRTHFQRRNWFPFLIFILFYQTPFFHGAKDEKILGIHWILSQHPDTG